MALLELGKRVGVVTTLSNVRTSAIKLSSHPSHRTTHASEAEMSLKTKGLTKSPFKQQFDNIHQKWIQHGKELLTKLLERLKKCGLRRFVVGFQSLGATRTSERSTAS